MKTYSEKLRDPRWQKKRLEIMNRDGFRCAYCGDSGSTLNVHHHLYLKGKNPWEYDNHLLVTLCEKCHSRVESVKKTVSLWMASQTSLRIMEQICNCNPLFIDRQINEKGFLDEPLMGRLDRLIEIAPESPLSVDAESSDELDHKAMAESSLRNLCVSYLSKISEKEKGIVTELLYGFVSFHKYDDMDLDDRLIVLKYSHEIIGEYIKDKESP